MDPVLPPAPHNTFQAVSHPHDPGVFIMTDVGTSHLGSVSLKTPNWSAVDPEAPPCLGGFTEGRLMTRLSITGLASVATHTHSQGR